MRISEGDTVRVADHQHRLAGEQGKVTRAVESAQYKGRSFCDVEIGSLTARFTCEQLDLIAKARAA